MTSKHILYTPKGITYGDGKCSSNNFIHIEAIIGTKNIKHIYIKYQYKEIDVDITLDKDVLAPCYYSILNNEGIKNSSMWKKLHVLDIEEDVFMYGFVSYITFFAIIEQGNLMDIFPFTFEVPCTLSNGDCCDASMMQYLLVPMESLLYNIPKLHYHFIHLIQKFIHQYTDFFYAGPTVTDEFMSKYTTESLGIDTSYEHYNDEEDTTCENICDNKYNNKYEDNTSFSHDESCNTSILDSMSFCDTCYDETAHHNTYNYPMTNYDNYDTIIKPLAFDTLTYTTPLFIENISEQPIIYLRFA